MSAHSNCHKSPGLQTLPVALVSSGRSGWKGRQRGRITCWPQYLWSSDLKTPTVLAAGEQVVSVRRGASYLGGRVSRVSITLSSTPKDPRKGLWRFGATSIKYKRYKIFTFKKIYQLRGIRLSGGFVLPLNGLGCTIFFLCESFVLLLVNRLFLGLRRSWNSLKENLNIWKLFLPSNVNTEDQWTFSDTTNF